MSKPIWVKCGQFLTNYVRYGKILKGIKLFKFCLIGCTIFKLAKVIQIGSEGSNLVRVSQSWEYISWSYWYLNRLGQIRFNLV